MVHLWRGCEAEGYDRWGPHAHVVGPGIDARRTDEYWGRTGGSYQTNPDVPGELVLNEFGKPIVLTQGVVVKQPNGKDGGFASYWGKSLVRHLVYELGHAAILPNAQALTYLGAGLRAYSPPPPEPSEDPIEEPTCVHGRPLRPLGVGGPPKFDTETREWSYRIDRERFYRFLDRAPAQGGPLLERVNEQGRATQIAISPYLDQRGLRPPPRGWAPPSDGPPRASGPPTVALDGPTDWSDRSAGDSDPDEIPPGFERVEGMVLKIGSRGWATAGACVGCAGRWREGAGRVSCPHRGEFA